MKAITCFHYYLLSDKKMNFWLLLPIVLIISGCVPPPAKESPSVGAPIVFPKPAKGNVKPDKVIGKTPQSTSAELVSLPQGWKIIDSKHIVEKVVYSAELGGILLNVSKDKGLGLFSATDATKVSYYRGMFDGAHLISLPTNNASKILIIMNNRKNARFPIWLVRE